jgi:hypothetical protein
MALVTVRRSQASVVRPALFSARANKEVGQRVNMEGHVQHPVGIDRHQGQKMCPLGDPAVHV